MLCAITGIDCDVNSISMCFKWIMSNTLCITVFLTHSLSLSLFLSLSKNLKLLHSQKLTITHSHAPGSSPRRVQNDSTLRETVVLLYYSTGLFV